MKSIAAGYYHACAVLESGAVRCWGMGGHGELGHGNGRNIGDAEVFDRPRGVYERMYEYV